MDLKNIFWQIIFFFLLVFSSCGKYETYQTTKDLPAGQPATIFLEDIDPHLEILTIRYMNHEYPLQRIDDRDWCFVPLQDLPIDAELEIKNRPSAFDTICRTASSGDFLVVNISEKEVLKYAVTTQYPADTLPTYYKRSGFIHPISTLSGLTITDDFPEGHVHQHGLFHAWTRTFIRDSLFDFWNQQAQKGDIRHREIKSIRNGPVFSSFEVGLDYIAYFPQDTAIVSDEVWKVTIYPLPENYLIDWQLVHTWLGPDSLVIDQYHYGGTAFRGCKQWNISQGAYDSLVHIETNLHKSHLEANHSRPTWITMYGLVESAQYAGLVIIPSPENLRYPQPVRVHPRMPYFCFAPMVLGKFILQPNDVYESNCRIMVYDGKPDYSLIERTVAAYTNQF